MIFQSHTKLLEQVNEKAFELEVPRVENYVLQQVTSYDDFHSGSSQKLEPLHFHVPQKDPERERPHHSHLHAKNMLNRCHQPKTAPRPQQTDT